MNSIWYLCKHHDSARVDFETNTNVVPPNPTNKITIVLNLVTSHHHTCKNRTDEFINANFYYVSLFKSKPSIGMLHVFQL